MTDYQRFYRNEGDYPRLDGEGACRRLSAAIACRTVNGTPGCDGEFKKLRQLPETEDEPVDTPEEKLRSKLCSKLSLLLL